MGAVRRLIQRAHEVGAGTDTDIPSPCVSICRMDPRTHWCEGCFRTIDEIVGWSGLHAEEKRKVWHMIERRARALTPTSTSRKGQALFSRTPEDLSQREREKEE